MQPPPEPHSDRRHSFRADVHGCAIVHGPGGASRCVVVDLCLGGVRLLELVRGASDLVPGAEVTCELEIAGQGWVVQRGRVLRHEQGELAIAFEGLSPEVEDVIEEEVLCALEARRAPRVVVVDRSEARRHRIAEALRENGCCSLEAATPLEAVDLIEQSRTHVSAVVVAETLTQTQADELIAFVFESHPDVKVALITEVRAVTSEAAHEPRWPLAGVITCEGDDVLVGPIRALAAQLPTIGAAAETSQG